MKIKVRCIEQKFCSGNEYRHFYIEVLDYKYKSTNTQSLEIIGSISFQSDKQRESEQDTYKWYAMRFNVSSDNPEHLLKMAKIAKVVKDNTDYRSQPLEVIRILDADEHIYFEGDFVPKIYTSGMNMYKILYRGNQLWTRIYAPNEYRAQRIFNKIVKEEDLSEAKLSEPIKVVNSHQVSY